MKEFLRRAVEINLLKDVIQFLLPLLVQALGKPLPAQGDGTAGNKDKFPAIPFKMCIRDRYGPSPARYLM